MAGSEPESGATFYGEIPTVEILEWGDQPKRCAHCGRTTGDYAGGHARRGDDWLCHPNAEGRPDCYTLVTVWRRPLGELRDGG